MTALALSALLVLPACASKPTVRIVGEYDNESGFIECGSGKRYEAVFPDTLHFGFLKSMDQLRDPGRPVGVELSGYLSESSSGMPRIYVMGFDAPGREGCGGRPPDPEDNAATPSPRLQRIVNPAAES